MKQIKKNPYAASLSNPIFRNKIVKSKKGKGSYSRKNKKY